jgi:hypothetical protein
MNYSGIQRFPKPDNIRSMKNNMFLFPLIFILILLSCSTPSYLSKPADFKNFVKGFYIAGVLNNQIYISGELIVANDSCIWLLPVNTNNPIYHVSRESIKKFNLFIASTSDKPEMISTWSLLAPFTTLGHGWYGMYSIPSNIILNSIIGGGASYSRYIIHYPNNISWSDLNKFARFPQGLPPGVNLNEIH